jgi:CheY-like chemotaxis protein
MKTPPKVLIVDDEPMTVMVLQILLDTEGYTFSGAASTKEEAVRLANENHPDFVLMDIRLIGTEDGIDAAREIAEQITTKIIFMTGYCSEEIKAKAMQLKPLAYLTKPLEYPDLISIIEQASR